MIIDCCPPKNGPRQIRPLRTAKAGPGHAPRPWLALRDRLLMVNDRQRGYISGL
jgi:hypothetical protein